MSGGYEDSQSQSQDGLIPNQCIARHAFSDYELWWNIFYALSRPLKLISTRFHYLDACLAVLIGFGFGDYEKGEQNSVLGLLKQTWMNEKCSPEILVYEDLLVDQIKELVETQQELVLDVKDTQKQDLQST